MQKKETRGGARKKIEPHKGRAKGERVSLHEKQTEWLRENFGSLTVAIRSVLPIHLQ